MDYSLLVGVHERNLPPKKCTATDYQHNKSIFEVRELRFVVGAQQYWLQVERGGIPSADGTKVACHQLY